MEVEHFSGFMQILSKFRLSFERTGIYQLQAGRTVFLELSLKFRSKMNFFSKGKTFSAYFQKVEI